MIEPTDRLHALDAVRGFALLLGVFFHAAFSFLPGEQAWLVTDTERSTALAITAFTLHMFRMTTFFLMAGFFARLVYHRSGRTRFVRDRAKRIAVPLVVFWPIVFPLIAGAAYWGAIVMSGGVEPVEAPPMAPAPARLAFPLTHLWFLYVLLIFYGIAILVRECVASIDGSERIRTRIDRLVYRTAGRPIAPLILAVPLFAAFALDPGWLLWTGIPTPDNSLVPNAIAFTAYGFAFTLGWLLHRQVPLMYRWKALWPHYLTAAIALTAVALALSGGLEPALNAAADRRQALGFAAAYAIAGWCWTLGFVGMALQFLSGFSAWRRYLADASYWIYLMHLPLVIALQVAVARLPFHWAAKYLFVVAVTLGVLLATYELLVRDTFLGALLNGRKKPKVRWHATSAHPSPVEGPHP